VVGVCEGGGVWIKVCNANSQEKGGRVYILTIRLK